MPIKYTHAELDDIIGLIFMFGGQQGGFMERMMLAWQTADFGNKLLIHPVIDELIRKYKLDEECHALRLKNPKAAKMSDDYLKQHESDDF